MQRSTASVAGVAADSPTPLSRCGSFVDFWLNADRAGTTARKPIGFHDWVLKDGTDAVGHDGHDADASDNNADALSCDADDACSDADTLRHPSAYRAQ